MAAPERFRGRPVCATLGAEPVRKLTVAAVVLAGMALGACKFVSTAEVRAQGAGGGEAVAVFDPDKMVAEMWQTKVVPYLDAKAGSLADVRELARRNPDEAGGRYGYRPKAEGAPWTLVTRFDGTVVAADTASRAATIDIDIDGDGKSDATVQIGPAIRGTALRDALDFVSFNNFTNQIDFARFGKAFNSYVDRTTLAKLPRDDLVGRRVTVVGAFPLGGADQPPLVTPATITIGPKP